MGIKSLDYNNDGLMDLFVTDMHSDMSEAQGPNQEKLKSMMRWPESMVGEKAASVFGNTFFQGRADGAFDEISDRLGTENYWPWGLSVRRSQCGWLERCLHHSEHEFPLSAMA